MKDIKKKWRKIKGQRKRGRLGHEEHRREEMREKGEGRERMGNERRCEQREGGV